MHPGMRIAVAGATGRVGRPLVELLETRGHEVVPISRSHGVDVVTGEGLADALAGVDCVVDAATGPSPDREEATAFFTAAARNLQEEGARAGVRRMVVVSIIGIDRFTGGYNAAKVAHEQAHLSGPVPARVLRAAQFHELVGLMMEWGRQGDVVYVPRMRTQPVAAMAVAEILADMAVEPAPAAPPGPFPEIAGPREESMVHLATLLAARRGDRVRVEGVSDPSDPDAGLLEGGAALPGPGAILAGPSFEEWLRSEVAV